MASNVIDKDTYKYWILSTAIKRRYWRYVRFDL